jgi:hypothetical protein
VEVVAVAEEVRLGLAAWAHARSATSFRKRVVLRPLTSKYPSRSPVRGLSPAQ